MLSNPMLDVAIGLIFLYLLLSIIVTVLQEFISSTLRLRNKNLIRAITELIGKNEAEKAEFFDHPLISPLFRGDVDAATGVPKLPPAYIPRRNFALAVLDLQARREAKRAAAEKSQHAVRSDSVLQPGLREASVASNSVPEQRFISGELKSDRVGEKAPEAKPSLAPAFGLAAFFEDAESGVGLSSRINKFGTTATKSA